MRKASNVDTVQPEIVKALRQIGASVMVLSSVGKGCPDLCVGFHGHTMLMECKTGADQLNAVQREWHQKWAGHVVVVRTPAEAQLAAINGSGL